MSTTAPTALLGLRVIEMGQLIARSFAGKTLAEFGADVIKIEPPDAGDALGTRGIVRTPAPRLGDHTDAVLAELGLSNQDIAALRGKKVVA